MFRSVTRRIEPPWAYAFYALALFLICSAVHAENRVSLTRWTYSRARKTIDASNRVTGEIQLKNVSGDDLERVRIAITLNAGLDQKVAGPFTRTFDRIKPAEVKPIQFVAEFVAAFNAYQVLVSYKGGEETWVSTTAEGDPVPYVDELIPNVSRVLLLGQDLNPGPKNMLTGRIKVKNVGLLEAEDVQVRVTFYAAPPPPQQTPKAKPDPESKIAGAPEAPAEPRRGKKLAEWKGKLGEGRVAGGEEKVFPVNVPLALPKGFHTLVVSVSCKEAPPEEPLAGGDFANIPDLETAQWRFTRTGKKNDTLEVRCQLRNGLDRDLGDIRILLTFFSEKGDKREVVKKAEFKYPHPLKPKQVVPVGFAVDQMPEFDMYEQTVAYGDPDEARKPAKEAKSAPKPRRDFEGQNTVEIIFKEFSTQNDGTVLVVCAARNGRDAIARDVVITATFLNADGSTLTSIEKPLPEPMTPGEIRNFVLRAPKAKGYAQVTHRVSFTESRPVNKPGQPSANEPQAKPEAKEDAGGQASSEQDVKNREQEK